VTTSAIPPSAQACLISRQARGGDDSGGQRSRLALTLKPRYQPREVLRYFAGKHDPDGVPQLCEKHMSAHRPSGFGEVAEVSGEPIFSQPLGWVIC